MNALLLAALALVPGQVAQPAQPAWQADFVQAATEASQALTRGDDAAAIAAWTRLLDKYPLRDYHPLQDSFPVQVAATVGTAGAPGGGGPLLAAARLAPRADPVAYLNAYMWQYILTTRGELYLRSGEPDKAVADFTRAIELNPDVPGAYTGRADAYDRLGEHDKAAADRRIVRAWEERMRNSSPDGADGWSWPGDSVWRLRELLDFWGSPSAGAAPRRRQALVAAVVLVLVLAGLVALNVWAGWRQMKDGNGRWPRLLFVAAALALLEIAPLAATFALLTGGLSGADFAATVVAGAVTCFLTWQLGLSWLHPLRWQGTRTAPPLLRDEAVLARVREIAGQMGIRPPVVRVAYSASSAQETGGAASCLAAPCLLVTDGTLHRLTPGERDGILAHELAHIANHTLWLWAGTLSACAVGTVLAAAFTPGLYFLLFGLALYTGAKHIVSRRMELDSDLRAARAVGFRAMTSALRKVHAGEPFRHSPLEFLIAATSTHPSRDERLAALHAAAPAGDRPDVTWDPAGVRRRRSAAAVAGALWLFVTAGSLALARARPDSWLPLLLLSAVVVTPTALILLGVRRALLRKYRRSDHSFPLRGWVRLAGLVGLAAYLTLYYAGWLDRLFGDPELGLVRFGVLGVLLLMLWLPVPSRNVKLEREVGVAFASRDYAAVVRLARRRPKDVARSPVLRHNVALARALLGDRDQAIEELEALVRDVPRLKQTWLTLAGIYIDEGKCERALDLLRHVAPKLKDDPGPAIETAWCLRRMGRLDEAKAELEKARRIDPNAPTLGVAAALAVDGGDYEAARELLRQAEELMPGDVIHPYLEAEIAVRTNSPDAPALLDRAEAAVRENPMALLDKQVAGLRRGAGNDER